MKRFFLLTALAMSVALPAQAVEYISTKVDGTRLFRCEYSGKEYKVSVKARGNGKYTVLRYGTGHVSYSGTIETSSHEAAAVKGCGQ